MSYFIILQIGELSNSDGRCNRASTSAAGSSIGQLRLRERIQGRKGRESRRGRQAWDGTRSGRIKHRQVCTKRASITSREETMRTTRKTTHTDGQHQSRGRNMERNFRTESTSADIFCVILLLRKKAKASFIQSHSLEIHRVCFQLLCLGSCGRCESAS